MTLFAHIIFFLSIFLAIDALFAMYNFEFSYMLELKRRYISKMKILPQLYRMKLAVEYRRDNTELRTFVQSAFVPWFALTLFTNLWVVPLIIVVSVGVSNLFYRKPYISPTVLLLNYIVIFSGHLFVITCWFMGLIK